MTGVHNYADADLESNTLTDDVLCDVDRTDSSNMNELITFWKSGKTPKMNSWAGFSKNNIALFNGLTTDELDAVAEEY